MDARLVEPKHERPPQILPYHGDVRIYHPYYGDRLLSFAAHDTLPEEPGGVVYQIVKDACYIIAKNENGFLAVDREGNNSVSGDPQLLKPGKYYYHLNSKVANYQVVADFASWPFAAPIPAHWVRTDRTTKQYAQLCSRYAASSTEMSRVVKVNDAGCIITNYVSCTCYRLLFMPSTPPFMLDAACENAHLVPLDQVDWFTVHSMDDYSLNPDAGINDVANGVTLRSDVHACLNRQGFFFYPIGERRYLAYTVKRHEEDYAELFHRREVRMHDRIAGEFLYARFAYNIINLLPQIWKASGRSVPIPQAIRDARDRRLEEKKQKKDKKSANSELHTEREDGDTETVLSDIPSYN